MSLHRNPFEAFFKLLFPAYAHKSSFTVRFAFPFIMFAAIVASLASVISGGSSFVSIKMNPQQVAEGDPVTLEIYATANTPVNAVNITVSYPSTQLRVDGIDTVTSVITLWTKEPYAKGGQIYFEGGTFQRGFIGEHLIARVKATALVAGIAHITTNQATFVAGDGIGSLVNVSKSDTGQGDLVIGTANSSLVGTAKVDIVTDIDGDGKVDLKDISMFMSAWFTRGHTYDFNGDGVMTFSDFSIILAKAFFGGL